MLGQIVHGLVGDGVGCPVGLPRHASSCGEHATASYTHADSQSSRGPSVPFQQVIVQITKSKKANAHKRMLLRNDMSLKKPGERLECQPRASAVLHACVRRGARVSLVARGESSARRTCPATRCESPGSSRATLHPTPRGPTGHAPATHSSRWRRRPAVGTSWQPVVNPGSPSRIGRLRWYRLGLPSEPGRGF